MIKPPCRGHRKGAMKVKVVNIREEVDSLDTLYVYKKIGQMNEHTLSVVQVADRTLPLHVHEHSDELFYVIEGAFVLETDREQFPMKTGDFLIVPKGTPHHPIVITLTKFLMVELAGTLNKENSGDKYED